jgi:hypothetical protein
MTAHPTLRVAAALLAGLLAACSGPLPVEDELRQAIEDFRDDKPGVTSAKIDALFAALDAEIATLKATAAAKPAGTSADETRRIAQLEARRSELSQAYASARLVRLGRAAGEAARGVGDSIGQGLEDAGRALREKMQDPPAH